MATTASATGIGAPVRRKEDQRFITGKGQYTDDINRQGQTYAYFVRSPHAHANIRRIDAAAALRKPGVLAIFTGDDIANRKGTQLDEATIRHELEGNLCRCTGYHNIVAAVKAGAAAMGGMRQAAE